MVAPIDKGLASGLIGVGIFELANLWQNLAPPISDLRSSNDIAFKQRLVDADVVVGLVTLTGGIAFAVLTKDPTIMILMFVTFGVLAGYYHQILAAPCV